ncbi:ROK family transcriptional regulator [Deinococcus deserti]|uniref:Putative transcriptional regulator, NagC family n=1 Tax=Deinococcus deserti (strain DSM 17065 / CIP 109153 / LMG 22923 / VCD115) TaxID=546414 RepID=C1D0G6_DEIDV|nr:ROK family transcriptional regulator [Deinococcus deserti]ACO45340.1 putative transcriptional regulator, NagC family [Deinococcus deserti VCD115]
MSAPASAPLDLAAIRARHTALLLQLLWERDRARVDIARDLGMSRSAISSIVSELIGVGLVQEGNTRGSGRAGRRATLLSLNARAAALLAIDLGASHVRMDLMDLRCRTLASRTVPHEVISGPAETYHLLLRLADAVQREAHVPADHVALVGLGVPGPVDQDTGRVIRPPNMPGWDGEPVREALQRHLGLEVLVDNDANLGAQAEARFGPHRGVSDLIYVKAATGIGAGVLLGGRLHRGVRGGAGEIGHISINEQGPVGRSGNPGSLESYAAAQVLVATAEARRAAGAPTLLTDPVTLPALVRHAETDPLARELWEDVGHHLGVAISTALNLFNPAVVVIGGRLAEAGPVFLNAVRSSALSRTMQINAERTRIDLSTLGGDAGVLGAGAMMLDQLLTSSGLPHLYAVSRVSMAAVHATGPPPVPTSVPTPHPPALFSGGTL